METLTETRFDALEFKRQAQESVQTALEGLSPEEEIRALTNAVAQGPFRDEQAVEHTEEVHPDAAARSGKRLAVVGNQ